MPVSSDYVPKLRKKKVGKHTYAVVTLDGRTIHCGKWGSKTAKAEYDRVTAEWLQNGRRFKNTTTTIGELALDYIRYAKIKYQKNGKPTRELGIAKVVIRRLNDGWGDSLAEEFGPVRFKAFRNSLVDEGLSRTTINHYMNHVIGTFRLGLENEKIRAESFLRLKEVSRLRKGETSASEPDPVRPVPVEDVNKTLLFLAPIVADMVRLQLATAMRPGEVCKIRPVEVDRTRDIWVYTPSSHKTEHKGKERVIHIGPEGQRILRPYLLRENTDYCFKPSESVEQFHSRRERKTPESCGNRKGKRAGGHGQPLPKKSRRPGQFYSTQSYGRAITAACKKASVKRWAPNQLRKTAATIIRKIADLETAQVVLGHASKSTTEKWYADPYIESAAAVMREIG